VHARLGALSPVATLERGYAIVRRGEDVVRSSGQVASGDEIAVRVADGSFGARVE
jgi:exodeoxyribonuclease VII large subunit